MIHEERLANVHGRNTRHSIDHTYTSGYELKYVSVDSEAVAVCIMKIISCYQRWYSEKHRI